MPCSHVRLGTQPSPCSVPRAIGSERKVSQHGALGALRSMRLKILSLRSLPNGVNANLPSTGASTPPPPAPPQRAWLREKGFSAGRLRRLSKVFRLKVLSFASPPNGSSPPATSTRPPTIAPHDPCSSPRPLPSNPNTSLPTSHHTKSTRPPPPSTTHSHTRTCPRSTSTRPLT